MECSSCGHGNPEAARFCNECGRPLVVSRSRSPAPEPRSYTPKHLVEKILHSRSAIEGERKQVTVLFADVKGSKAQLAKEGVAARRKARAGLARVERLVKATGARAHRPFACEVRALLARTADDAGAARSALREAHRLFAAMGATGHAERVAQELAELRGGPRNAPEAP